MWVGGKGQTSHCLGVSLGWGLAGSGQSVLLERVVLVPSRGYFTLRVSCQENQLESSRSKWRQSKPSSCPAPWKTTFRGGTRVVFAVRSGNNLFSFSVLSGAGGQGPRGKGLTTLGHPSAKQTPLPYLPLPHTQE